MQQNIWKGELVPGNPLSLPSDSSPFHTMCSISAGWLTRLHDHSSPPGSTNRRLFTDPKNVPCIESIHLTYFNHCFCLVTHLSDFRAPSKVRATSCGGLFAESGPSPPPADEQMRLNGLTKAMRQSAFAAGHSRPAVILLASA